MSVDKTILNKLRAVAAAAESLADDYENSRLWVGDLKKKLTDIHVDLNDAREIAHRVDR